MTPDVKPEGRPEAAAVAAEMERLSATREALLDRPVREIARLLGRAGARLADPEDPLTREARDAVAVEAGYSGQMAGRVVAGMARDWSPDRLRELLLREFDDPAVLDGWVPDGRGGRRLRAVGDPVAVHLCSGSVPGVSTTSLVRSLLVKTPVLVKPGAGDRALTTAFHTALAEEDGELAASATVLYWPGDDEACLAAALERTRRVVVYGGDATASAVRRATPVTTPVVAYHHRLSVAIVGTAAIDSPLLEDTADALSLAVATFDQRGCVSPHRVFVLGSRETTERLGEALAAAMAREAGSAPPGTVDPEEAARVQQLRSEIELRAAAGEGVALWRGEGTSWTVVLDPEGGRIRGLPRTLVLVPVDSAGLAEGLGPLSAHLQSAGVAGLGEQAEEVAERLTRLGVTRVVPLADMPFPPAWWHHDGAGPLRALVRWAEWEG
ncbi:MAG TPA: acyl-CoA reductase [Longimicrobiales bacterium]|nr:acyl-CoA reductase [Longimicrobiales bacterium]